MNRKVMGSSWLVRPLPLRERESEVPSAKGVIANSTVVHLAQAKVPGQRLTKAHWNFLGGRADWLDFPGPPIQTHGRAVRLTVRHGRDFERLPAENPSDSRRKMGPGITTT
jgi:hypothetical protein